MSFTNPLALLLLLTVPLVLYIGWPRYAFRRRRDSLSLALRVIIVLLVILALAGAQIVGAVDRLAVIFLVDVSDSMGQSLRAEQLNIIRSAIQTKSPDDIWAIVAFGANPLVEQSFTTLSEVNTIQSNVVTTHTHIAAAIQTAIGMFPADARRRIVILSDGQATLGDARAKAQLAAAAGIEISYVHLARQPSPDVIITALEAPNRVAEGQEFDLSVTIESEIATNATLRIFSRGEIIYEQPISLRTGTNRYTLSQVSGDSGFLDFSAQIVADNQADRFRQNNRLSTFSQVIGPPRILLVAIDDAEIAQLTTALLQNEIQVETIVPQNLPLNIAELANYRSIILANVPATHLSDPQMDMLDRYVKDLGGGLIVIGGPDAYGPGGYFQRPIERMLPVEIQIKDQQRLPQLTIAYIIDRSGSMGMIGESGVPNIELAKEAIIRSIDFLQSTDRAGIASFDVDGSWVAELQDIADKRTLQRFVATLRSGGGTDIMAGMQLVADSIIEEPSVRKHIILMTDGGASSAGLIELTESLNRDFGVTTSTIAIGARPPDFLRQMAEAGGGNYHEVANIQDIPTIFALETVLASRTYIIEEPFVPTLTAISPIMDGITALPTLRGYVATTPKPVAQMILSGPEPFRDPILATWQYGLGRVVAFTSDATARWASDWVLWSDFPRFWSQTINWSITEGTESNLETQVVMEGQQARIIVEARMPNGDFLNGLALSASVLDPNNNGASLRLQQVAPGRYEALFTPNEEGAYYLAVNGTGDLGGDSIAFNTVSGWVMSYSPEYQPAGPLDDRLLADLADITGGRSLSDDLSGIFSRIAETRAAATPIWPLLLALVLLLLPVDIAVRRLIIMQSDLVRLRAFLFGRRQTLPVSERVSSLMSARERARQKVEETASSVGTIANLRARKTEREINAIDPIATKSQGDTNTPTAPKSSPLQPNPDENIGARLLKKRRQRDDN